jgi:hypothetical protein
MSDEINFTNFDDIPRVDGTTLDGSVTTPEWMVTIDGLTTGFSKTTGKNDKFADFVELHGFLTETKRMTRGNAAANVHTSANVTQTETALILRNGKYLASILNQLQSGKPVAKIEIVRLGNVAGNHSVKLRELIFKNCVFVRLQDRLDTAVVTFRASSITSAYFDFDQTGTSTGKMAAEYDFTTGVPKIGS